MSFFQSEVVRAEMAEIHELQEEVYSNVFKFLTMNNEDKAYHIDIPEKLVDKQRVMYTRICLSDDPEAKKMKANLVKSVSSLGFPPGTDVQVLFLSMTNTIEALKSQLDG